MGLWPAFWILGANLDKNGGDTPLLHSGEIDSLELFGFRDDAVVGPISTRPIPIMNIK